MFFELSFFSFKCEVLRQVAQYSAHVNLVPFPDLGTVAYIGVRVNFYVSGYFYAVFYDYERPYLNGSVYLGFAAYNRRRVRFHRLILSTFSPPAYQ